MQRLRRRSVPGGISLTVFAVLLLPTFALPQEKHDSGIIKPDEKPEYLIAKQQALFERVNLAEAWEITKGDPKVLVGVIDNGFDFFHPDLKGQLIPGIYCPGGYYTEFYENVAHGTLVSSLIVAKDNNPAGMVGLAPNCRVLTASQGMIEHTLVKMQSTFFKEHPKATLADWQTDMIKHPFTLMRFGRDWVHF